jgi:hypothetical protein
MVPLTASRKANNLIEFREAGEEPTGKPGAPGDLKTTRGIPLVLLSLIGLPGFMLALPWLPWNSTLTKKLPLGVLRTHDRKVPSGLARLCSRSAQRQSTHLLRKHNDTLQISQLLNCIGWVPLGPPGALRSWKKKIV